MKNLLLSFILFCFSSLSSYAIDIKGQIVDFNTKEPIEFVTAVLLKSDSSYITGSQSDERGTFLLTGQFPKQNYLLKTTYLGYKTLYIKIDNLSSNLDLGIIEVEEDSNVLGEVTITGQRRISKVDRQIVLPDSMQIKASVNAFDLLGNLSLSRLNIDPVNRTLKIGTEEVQLRINGVRASVQEVSALRSQDILRVEYFEDSGVRFGNENVGAVINLIVDRQKKYGGYVSVDGRNAPFVGFGDDNLTFKTNYKASEFGLNYYINYRSYNDRWMDNSEVLNFPTNPIMREQNGVKAPMEYQYQYVNFSYNLTSPDKYVFNVVFKNQFYHYDNIISFNNIYSDRTSQTFSSSKNKGNEYTPVLDIYYKQELKNKQSLTFNIVGTYINSDSKKAFYEIEGTSKISDIYNQIDGNKYSMIGEAVYEKQFESLSLSSGIKHTQGVADNTYKGDTNTETKMRNAESYGFIQVQGKMAQKLGYTLGVGGSRIWYKEGSNDAVFYTFRPSVQLNYSVNDNFSLKYSFLVNTGTPSLGQLSDVVQQTDSYQLSKGNPNLKPSNSYNNRLIFSYNKGIFDLSATFGYMYFDKLIINTFTIENEKIISFSENHKGQHYLYWNGNISAKIIKNVWTVDGWINASRDIFESNQGAIYTYNGINAGIRSNLMYKNYHLVFGMNTRYKDLWGETVTYGDDWNYVEAGYKYKEAKLSLGMSYPFKNYWSAGRKSLSAIKPSRNWTYIEGNGHMFYVRFSWNMSFGRKHEAGQKSLNNSDSDKGIL